MGATNGCERSNAAREVLVVDDNRASAELAGTYLDRLCGLSVVTETDPTAAVERLGRPSLVCVVSDYQMPEMDGLEFLRAVGDRRGDVATVLFTNVDDADVRERARERGATYLRKGGTAGGFDELAETVERELRDADR